MKAIAAVCATGASVPAISSGRVHRHRDGENAEIKMYLSKLQDLVPFMPKDRKISKLEVIQHVIDYICELQSALETHPNVGAFDAAAALEGADPYEWGLRSSHGASSPRQPLGPLSAPNTILLASPAPTVPLHQSDSSSHHHHTISDKSPQQTRPTSC